MLLSDLCRGQRRDAGLLVVAFGSPGGDHCIWDLERLIEYGSGDDAVGSKVPDVVAQFAPRADERRLDVISEGKWLDDPFGAAARKTVLHESPMGLIRQSKYLFRLKEAADRVESERD
jgi:hypothetical protein